MRLSIFVFSLVVFGLNFSRAHASNCGTTLGDNNKDYSKLLEKFFNSNHYDNATPFLEVQRSDLLPIFQKALVQAEESLTAIENNLDGNLKDTILALEHASFKLARISGTIGLIKSADSDEIIEAAEKESASTLSAFSNRVIQSEKIFQIIQRFHKDQNLGKEERRIVDRLYKSFVRNGALVKDAAHKKRIAEIDQRISDLSTSFESNVTKSSSSTLIWAKNADELEGLDTDTVNDASKLASTNGRSGEFAFAMRGVTYQRIMSTAKNRGLREKAYRAFNSRAKSGEFDNTKIIPEIVKLRAEKANILGFSSYAEYVLSDRMAKNIDMALAFEEELAKASFPIAQIQFEELKEFAAKELNIPDMKPWDTTFVSEALSDKLFGFTDESLRPYFNDQRVLQSSFDVAEKLFGVKFKLRNDIPTYNSDVSVFEVMKNGSSIGLLYVDLYERDNKKQGAWMGNYRTSGLNEKGSYENAHATIVGGFRKGQNGEPTQLSLNEVSTVFHELGHALHSLLSVAKYKSNTMASATWDFIELPSQFMEDWVYEREIFFNLAINSKTGEKISEELYQKILSKRTFLGALFMIRQVQFGLLDLHMYRDSNADLSNIEAFEKRTIGHLRVTEHIPGVSILPTMQHIISGGYSTGYYSYMWADRMVADAFKYFKDNGGFNPEIAKRFLETIMSQGDLVDADELYRMFRGRDPDSAALLEKYGITHKH